MNNSDNLRHWNNMCSPPKNALKKIDFGALAGKQSIDPTWRLMAMTKEYGPVGEGWIYKIMSISYQPVADDQMMVIVEAGVSVLVEGEWSPPIPGIGTAMLIHQTFDKQNKKYVKKTDAAAIKKALSDGLSVALKAFGVGASVYMGLYDNKPRKRTADERVEPRRSLAGRPMLWKN